MDPKGNHMCPYKREAEVVLITYREGRGNVTTKAEIGVIWSQVKELWQPLETGRVKKQKTLP